MAELASGQKHHNYYLQHLTYVTGLTNINEYRRYHVSFPLATTRLSCAGRGSYLKCE